jgi:hypothetical protein
MREYRRDYRSLMYIMCIYINQVYLDREDGEVACILTSDIHICILTYIHKGNSDLEGGEVAHHISEGGGEVGAGVAVQLAGLRHQLLQRRHLAVHRSPHRVRLHRGCVCKCVCERERSAVHHRAHRMRQATNTSRTYRHRHRATATTRTRQHTQHTHTYTHIHRVARGGGGDSEGRVKEEREGGTGGAEGYLSVEGGGASVEGVAGLIHRLPKRERKTERETETEREREGER